MRIKKIISQALLAIMLTNCGTSSTTTPIVTSTLSISPNATTVTGGATSTFTASGGTSPYTFSVASGGGTVTTGGVFTAPTTSGASVIQVTDAAKNVVTATVTTTVALTASASPSTSVSTNTAVTITASGGTGSYTYTKTSGSGTLNSNVYTTPIQAESAVITVTDSAGASTAVSISVTVGTGSGSSGIFQGFVSVPMVGQVITGATTFSATVSISYGVSINKSGLSVQFLLGTPSSSNLVSIGTQNYNGSYTTGIPLSFDPTGLPPGSYTLHLYAQDSANNSYPDIASPVTFIIATMDPATAALCAKNKGTSVLVTPASGNPVSICQVPSASFLSYANTKENSPVSLPQTANMCPSDMQPYGDGNWTTTSATQCDGGYSSLGCLGGQDSGSTGSHSIFSDIPEEQTWKPQRLACGGSNSGVNVYCYAQITSLGCIATSSKNLYSTTSTSGSAQ